MILEEFMKAYGKRIKEKVMVLRCTVMEMNIEDPFVKTNNLEMVSILGRMGISMKEIGLMERDMVKDIGRIIIKKNIMAIG